MNTKLLIAVFSLLLLSSCSLFKSDTKNYLWKISDDDSYVYLLGSIHIGKPEMFPLDSSIENAYSDSDFLAVEINTENINPMDVMMKGVYAGDSTLQDVLTPETYDQLSEIFKKYKIPEASFNKFKPWMAIMTALQLELNSSGYESASGIDNYFMTKAKKDNKNILELETFEDQIAALSSMDNMADEYLKYSLEEMESTQENIDDMYKYWMRGDTSGIAKIVNMANDVKGYEVFNKRLLVDRNYKITEKITDYLENDQTVFIIFGAGHFTGSTGVLNLLEAKDLKITQK